MQKTLIALTIAAVAAMTAYAPIDVARAQKGVPADVMKELAPTGKLRAGINLGNSVLAQKSAERRARRHQRRSRARARQAAGRAGRADRIPGRRAVRLRPWRKARLDIAFFAIEPKRAAEVVFSPPYAVIDGAYMVAKDSPLKTPADVDRPGIRVGVGLGSAYDLYLTRTLKNATIVRAKVGGGQASIDLYYAEKLDAAAGVRQPLDAHAKTNPNVRVMQAAVHGDPAGHGRAAGPAGGGTLRARLRRGDEEERFCRRRT